MAPSAYLNLLPRHDTTSSPSMSHSGHGTDTTSSSSSSGGGGGHMSMAFHASLTDTLFSTSWTPRTTGHYAGTIIFLILLAVIQRGLAAYKSVQEVKWHRLDSSRVIVVAGSGRASRENVSDIKNNTVEVSSAQARAGSINSGSPWSKPWRLSTDLPRAALGTAVSGVGYLLMLAVMTFNVGYFLAVLSGLFLGELVFGRFIKAGDH